MVTVSGNKVGDNGLSKIRKPSQSLDAQVLRDIRVHLLTAMRAFAAEPLVGTVPPP